MQTPAPRVNDGPQREELSEPREYCAYFGLGEAIALNNKKKPGEHVFLATGAYPRLENAGAGERGGGTPQGQPFGCGPEISLMTPARIYDISDPYYVGGLE
jgi:hypothetical protein